jgi:hypothetical protein
MNEPNLFLTRDELVALIALIDQELKVLENRIGYLKGLRGKFFEKA